MHFIPFLASSTSSQANAITGVTGLINNITGLLYSVFEPIILIYRSIRDALTIAFQSILNIFSVTAFLPAILGTAVMAFLLIALIKLLINR